jgi:hypothetical protein
MIGDEARSAGYGSSMTQILAIKTAPAVVSDVRADRLLTIFFVALLLASTLLQKFGIVEPLSMVVVFGGLAVLAFFGVFALNPIRVALYAIFVTLAFVSQILSFKEISAPAILLLIIIYIPFLFEFRVSESTYIRMMNIFVNIMIFISVIITAQQVTQYTIGVKYWPDLNRLPSSILISGYNYWRETAYHSNRFMPNGVFFLEPSIVAQFLALGVVVELSCFARPLRTIALVLAVVLTTSGTGLVLLALTSPLLIARLSPRYIIMIVAGLVIVLIALFASGLADHLMERASEFTQPGTSGYIRFTDPLLRSAAALAGPEGIYTGRGAGNSSHDLSNFNETTLTKVLGEYGLLTMGAFLAFFCYCVFAGAYRGRIAFALFVYDMTGGAGLSVPVYVLTIALLGTLFRVKGAISRPGPPARRQSRWPSEPPSA